MRNSRTSCQHISDQGGQAILEGLVALIGLLSLWVAISWLGKLQDLALQADHASRHAAFSLTRQSPQDLHAHQLLSSYLYAPQHRWSDSAGQALQDSEHFHVEWTVERDRQLDSLGQVGGNQLQATKLRRDWGLHDEGIYRSRVTVTLDSGQPSESGTAWWNFALAYPVVNRSTSILAGAGHAVDDNDAQTMMGSSDLAWRQNAGVSHRLAASITDVMKTVDQGWQRVAPATDWLDPWADLVPGSRKQSMPSTAFGKLP